MTFKYYDLLSNLTVGIVVFYVIWKLLFPNWENNEWVVIPAGYVVGYFLNAISSLIEPLLFKTICGKPSDKLLTPVPGQKWTGIKKVKFYFANEAVKAAAGGNEREARITTSSDSINDKTKFIKK